MVSAPDDDCILCSACGSFSKFITQKRLQQTPLSMLRRATAAVMRKSVQPLCPSNALQLHFGIVSKLRCHTMSAQGTKKSETAAAR